MLAEKWQRRDVDFLVNNAGIGIHASFMETTEEQFGQLGNIHLKATFFIRQKLVPRIKDGGRIVNVSTGLARYMAKELGARAIRVNVIAPGAIETDFGGTVSA